MERLLQDAEKLTGVKYDINNLSDVYEAIHAVQEELNITGTTALEASETLSGSFSAMKASFKDLMGNIALGQNVGESLKHLGETVSTFVFGNLLPMLGNILKSIPSLLLTFVTEVIPQLASSGIEMVKSLIAGVKEGWPEFKVKIGELWENTKGFISEKLPELIEKGKAMIVNLAKGFFDNLPEFMDKVAEFLSEAIKYINDNLPEWIEKGAEFVKNLVSGLIDKIPDFIKGAGELIGKALSYLAENLPKFLLKGGEIILSLVKGLVTNFPKILLTIGKFIVEMIGKLIGALPKFLDAGTKFIGSLIKGIGSMIGELLKIAGKLALDSLDTIKDAFLGIVDIGKNLVKGLWEGIKSVKDWILGKINGFVDSIMGGIKKFFGIHSPSKVMANEVGKYLPLGLAQGISENLRPVSKAMDEMGELAIRDFDSDVEMTIGSSFKRNPINDNQDLMFENEDNDQPIVIYLSIGGQVFKAFVDRVSLEQNKQVELELAY